MLADERTKNTFPIEAIRSSLDVLFNLPQDDDYGKLSAESLAQLRELCEELLYLQEIAGVETRISEGAEYTGKGQCHALRLVFNNGEQNGNGALADFDLSKKGEVLAIRLWGESNHTEKPFLSLRPSTVTITIEEENRKKKIQTAGLWVTSSNPDPNIPARSILALGRRLLCPIS